MPKWHVCIEDGCPEITQDRSRRCPTHRTARSPSSRLTSATGYRRLRAEVLERDAGICHLCGLPRADTVDHIEPAAYGGTNSRDNLNAAHAECNRRKSNTYQLQEA